MLAKLDHLHKGIFRDGCRSSIYHRMHANILELLRESFIYNNRDFLSRVIDDGEDVESSLLGAQLLHHRIQATCTKVS